MQLVLTFPITSNEGERSFSLLKRILHYTRFTMTESRLNDLALIMTLHPTRLSELSTEKIIEMLEQANPRKLKLKRVSEYVDGVNSIEKFQKQFRLLVKI